MVNNSCSSMSQLVEVWGGGSAEGVDAAMRPEVEGKQPLLAAIAAATEEAWEGG